MKLKKTAIALAVASVSAAPMAASAADGAIYGSIRLGFENTSVDNGADSTQIRDYASRLGFRGETELSNGVTAYGRYEWGVRSQGSESASAVGSVTLDTTDANNPQVTTTDATANTAFNLRHAVVGLKFGDHGNLFLGQTYHTWYNFISGSADAPWWGSGNASINYRGRTGNTISYAGDFGLFSFGISGVFDDSRTAEGGEASESNDNELIDQMEIAGKLDFGVVDVALGVQTTNGEPTVEDVIGLAVNGSAGPVGIAFNFQSQADAATDANGNAIDQSGTVLNLDVAGFYLHLENLSESRGSGSAQSATTLGYTLNLGPRTSMWFEYEDLSSDDSSYNDGTWLRAALKYDF